MGLGSLTASEATEHLKGWFLNTSKIYSGMSKNADYIDMTWLGSISVQE